MSIRLRPVRKQEAKANDCFMVVAWRPLSLIQTTGLFSRHGKEFYENLTEIIVSFSENRMRQLGQSLQNMRTER